MKLLSLFMLLFVSGCMPSSVGTPIPVTFEQLVRNPRVYEGSSVRLRCTMSLFGERTMFTASGLNESFDCEAIYLQGGDQWKATTAYVTLGNQAREVLDLFRQEHPDLRWPEVEVEVELVAIFRSVHRGYTMYTVSPTDLLNYRLIRVIALRDDSPKSSLLRFPLI